MQFERSADGTMTPLPKPCVDTGMGLERISAVLQHVHSNYEIDLFQSLIQAAARETKTSDLSNNSLKVIADHIRACSFLIIDGSSPAMKAVAMCCAVLFAVPCVTVTNWVRRACSFTVWYRTWV